MNINNITSDSMTLTNNGKAMLIKIYEEEIERLKEQLNDEIDDELKQSEIMVKQQNEIERLKDDNKYLNKVNIELSSEKNRLKSIINKAIEYIEQLTNDEESIELMDIDSLVQEELLKILKGSDKE